MLGDEDLPPQLDKQQQDLEKKILNKEDQGFFYMMQSKNGLIRLRKIEKLDIY